MMTYQDIACQRLSNQHISQQTYGTPDEIVRRLGAVQSQDYAAAKWALGLRLQGVTDRDIEQAFDDGAILRTHVMRPTWHFVSPVDIRWLLTLTAPRVHVANAYWYRKLELDDEIFQRSNTVLTSSLQGGKQLTRAELATALQRAGIMTDDTVRLASLMMHAELDGLICSGARQGKQFTYALLEERVPPVSVLAHDEALALLTSRYFTSHGPATLYDFAWWSGLTVAEASMGLDMVRSRFVCEVVDSQTYWFSPEISPDRGPDPVAYLLPNFDEYTVSYKDRSAICGVMQMQKPGLRDSIFTHVIVIHGQVMGTWKRTIKKDSVLLMPSFFAPLDDAEAAIFLASVKRYATFLDCAVNVTFPLE
jgi:hypothetical protein